MLELKITFHKNIIVVEKSIGGNWRVESAITLAELVKKVTAILTEFFRLWRRDE